MALQWSAIYVIIFLGWLEEQPFEFEGYKRLGDAGAPPLAGRSMARRIMWKRNMVYTTRGGAVW
ncbi:MAG TPA: hypothetical protein DCW86_01250 [Actinobacteria bacterium]|nr:hypothetical protein [Actinomycetota bacterium]